MDRRSFMTTSLLAAAGALTGLRIAPVAAQSGTPGIAVAQSFPVGSATVTALSDGFLPITAEALQGITPEDFQSLLRAAYIDGDGHPTGVNAYLIEIGEERILVDTGTGQLMGPGLGQLGANMAAFGVDPASIGRIIATHLHPDHIGGILAPDGNPYTGAGLTVSQPEIDFWRSDEIRNGAPEQFRPFFDQARAAVDAFGDRLEVVAKDADLGNGITLVPLPGHTLGHTGVMLESEGSQLLIWGDIVHVGPVQFARPEVTIVFDTAADMAAATRAEILARAAADRMQIAGMHISFPGIGYVEAAQEGYRFVPRAFPYG